MSESFEFAYTRPSLDWYETIKRTVGPDDYERFELQLRYGLTWWLIGHKADKGGHDIPKDIGRLSRVDAVRFIKWAKRELHGSDQVEFSAISTALNLAAEISKLMEGMWEWKPCPFCGGDGGIGISPQDHTIYGCCWVCGARGMPIHCDGSATQRDYDQAQAAWNGRYAAETEKTEADIGPEQIHAHLVVNWLGDAHCSNCGAEVNCTEPFCQHCGARLDEPETRE